MFQILQLLIIPLTEIISCGVLPSLQIKTMKQKNYSDLQFKSMASKKEMFSDLGTLNLFKSGRWESLLAFPKGRLRNHMPESMQKLNQI